MTATGPVFVRPISVGMTKAPLTIASYQSIAPTLNRSRNAATNSTHIQHNVGFTAPSDIFLRLPVDGEVNNVPIDGLPSVEYFIRAAANNTSTHSRGGAEFPDTA
jgi:hypothetical protein